MKTSMKRLLAAVLCVMLAVGICASALGELFIKEENIIAPSLLDTLEKLCLQSEWVTQISQRMIGAHKVSDSVHQVLLALKNTVMEAQKPQSDIERSLSEAQSLLERAKDLFESYVEKAEGTDKNLFDRIKNHPAFSDYFDALTRGGENNRFKQFDAADVQVPILAVQ